MLVKRVHKPLAIIWLCIVICALVFVADSVRKGGVIQTDVLSFLPNLNQSPELQETRDQYNSFNNSQFVVLLTGADKDELVAAADSSSTALISTGYWKVSPSYAGARDTDVKQLWQWYLSYANGVLAKGDVENLRSALQSNRYDQLLKNTNLLYASPFAMSSSSIKDDPLFLLQNFFSSNISSPLRMQKVGVWPVLEKEKSFAVIMVFEAFENVYDLGVNQRLALAAYSERNRMLDSFPSVKMVMTGAFLHVYQGSTQAKTEVSTVGLGSLIAILILFFWLFKSLLPFLSSVLVLGAGLLISFALMLMCFGAVHIMAIVFCATVIGLGIDYTLHFYAHRHESITALATAKKIALPTGLGMFTSALAFLALAFVPFPGFQQLSLLVSVGLVSVWVSMILWFPYIPWGKLSKQRSLDSFNQKTLALQRVVGGLFPRRPVLMLVVACVVFMFGAMLLKPNDDIRQLQAQFPELREAEVRIQEWLGLQNETAYFVVSGTSPEDVLLSMEALCDALRNPADKFVESVQCLTDWLPSQARQDSNYKLLVRLAMQGGPYWQGLKDLGLPDSVLHGYRQHLLQSQLLLTAEDFWQGPMAARFEPLWYPLQSGSYSSVVRVFHIMDVEALRVLAENSPSIHWVDQVSRYSELFQHFRTHSSVYVFFSYAFLLFILAFRYGWLGSLKIVLPIFLAALGVLFYLGVTASDFNLFSVLALILVAGMGIDYGIFLREEKSDEGRTLMAIVISAFTTTLAFGLLALSQTNAIRSFGVVVLVGISIVLITTVFIYSYYGRKLGNH